MNRYKKANEGIHAPEEVKTKAAQPAQKSRRWVGAAAAVLAVVMIGGMAAWFGQNGRTAHAAVLAQAQYPAAERSIIDTDGTHPEVLKNRIDTTGILDQFLADSVPEFLSGAGEENRVYSPLNVYMALSMLAETTGGNSRSQILDLLDAASVEELRQRAAALWAQHYRDGDLLASTLANSLWLADGLTYNQTVLDTLAKHYCASSFQGTMGSKQYDKMLCDWINEQTKGLLQEQAGQLSFDPTAVLGLASTVYFKGSWEYPFWEERTRQAVFHAPSGDMECEFMGKELAQGTYYWGDHFSAVEVPFQDWEWSMWLILPDEGWDMDQLLNSGEAVRFLTADKYGQYDWQTGETISEGWPNQKRLRVNLSLPKFDVSSDLDLTDGLKALGVTDVFGSAADFSPLGAGGAYVSQAQHAARVMVDEEGCAAAYVDLMLVGAAPPPDEEVDFTLDRPFLFAICGEQPLFIGVVNQP